MQMELGLYHEAMNMLRTILPHRPCDSITLTSFALCLSALGYKPPPGLTSANYPLKIKLMDDPNEFLNSTDPEELFEAGSTFNLENIFLQVPFFLIKPSLWLEIWEIKERLFIERLGFG